MHELFPSGPTMLFRVKERQIRGLADSPGSTIEDKHRFETCQGSEITHNESRSSSLWQTVR